MVTVAELRARSVWHDQRSELDVEQPRAYLQLICDWRIEPVEVVALTDIQPAP